MDMNIETVGAGFLGTAAVAAFVSKLWRSWISEKRDTAKDNAETSIYRNLLAENTRMSAMIEKLSLQVAVLMEDNTTLQAKLASVERQLQASHDWEQTAQQLQEELKQRDLVIAQVARSGNYQALQESDTKD